MKTSFTIRAIINIIAHIAPAKVFVSFMFVNFLRIFKQNITAILKNDIRASAQIKMKSISGRSKNALSLLFIIIKYIGEILLIGYMSEKANTSKASASIRKIPQMSTEEKATLDVSSFLLSIGEMK